MINKYIIPFYFFIALFIGLFVAYVSTPVPDVIIQYPTPENAGKIIYKDDADVCYKYKAEEVSCPKDKSKIKNLDEQVASNKSSNEENKETVGTVNVSELKTKIVKNVENFFANLNNKYSLY